ncbi:DUF4307 domain-containing protein [Motilibacter aurantiacus]|uniref:DUF4307 domain-containing protein n=1 Tax=Motilibacter aurantiacus TaxID=2714955 RepID=UPI002F2B372D
MRPLWEHGRQARFFRRPTVHHRPPAAAARPSRGVDLSVPPSARRPPERYGDLTRGRRRALVAGVAALAVAGAGWLAWAGISAGDKDVHARVLSYDPVDARGVATRVEIRKPRDEEAVCRLRALDRAFATVGRADAVAPAGTEKTVLELTVPTTAQAVNAELVRCALR